MSSLSALSASPGREPRRRNHNSPPSYTQDDREGTSAARPSKPSSAVDLVDRVREVVQRLVAMALRNKVVTALLAIVSIVFGVIVFVPPLEHRFGLGFSLIGGGARARAGRALVHRVDKAMAEFDLMASSQSRDVPSARTAYVQRYRRQPPPGFDDWVQFAFQHNSTIIDDFDQLEADLAPFRRSGLTGARLRKAIADAKVQTPGEMLGSISIRHGRPVVFGPLQGTMSADTLEGILQPVASRLPDLTVLFNWYAEPRVLANGGSKASSGFSKVPANMTWNVLRSTCRTGPLSASGGTGSFSSPSRKRKQTLVNDYDVCGPGSSRYRQWHGFFNSPDNLIATDSLVPLLSRARTPNFNDILIPNPCYSHQSYRHFEQVDRISYEDKKPAMYWRGTTTGIKMTLGGWHHGHRHRFVQYSNLLAEAAKSLDMLRARRPSSWSRGSSRGAQQQPPLRSAQALKLVVDGQATEHALMNLKPSVFDVDFTSFEGCEGEMCTVLASYYNLRSFERAITSMENQIVADIDGQSMSCRFYHLLESNSLVLKQTIWKEWHSDRILPYVHYMPLSLSLEELPVMLDWLLNDPIGRARAKAIAELGASWSKRSLRPIDISIYYYRVLLEYASLYYAPDDA